MTKKICISGYYGFDNFGDETILKILVENIKKYCDDAVITVFSSSPHKTAKELGVNSIHTFNIKALINSVMHCDCLISGGGSLLQDATSKKSLIYYLFVLFSAQFFRKRTIIFAQGIGPVNDKFLRRLTANVIKKAKYVTLRDIKSVNLVKQWGIDAFLCNDPVWNIEINNIQKQKKTGIQLRAYSFLTDEFLSELARLVNKYYSDKEINIFSLQNNIDLKVCEDFKQRLSALNPKLNVKVIKNCSNEKLIEDVSSLDDLIAMRYHACLIGIKAGVKVLPLSYDIKVETLAKEFDMEYVDLKSTGSFSDIFERFFNSTKQLDRKKIESLFFDFKTLCEKI